MTDIQNNELNNLDMDDQSSISMLERPSYKFFAQYLDEGFNDIRGMHASRKEMESHPEGTPEHHIAAARMYGNIINHSKDMVNLHTKGGDMDKVAHHQKIIKNATAEATHHLAQYHFAMANRHATSGNIASAINHQVKGEAEMNRHRSLIAGGKEE